MKTHTQAQGILSEIDALRSNTHLRTNCRELQRLFAGKKKTKTHNESGI